MRFLRAFLLGHRRFAAVLLTLALCMKALVPAGYMIAPQARMLSVAICSDASGVAAIKQIAIPVSGKPAEGGSEHGKSDSSCPYTALSLAALGGADAALLVLAIAYILALGFAAAPPLRLVRITFLRPPLRGPPALA